MIDCFDILIIVYLYARIEARAIHHNKFLKYNKIKFEK